MAWSDDMRCLYCDGKLPLYRKITHGQFCSTAHRKAYWQEQERLAIERLHQTHNSLKAFRLPVPAESILGPAVPVESVLSGFVKPPEVLPQSHGAPRIVWADPLAYELERLPGKPVWTLADPAARGIAGAGLIHLFQTWFSRWDREALMRPCGGELDPCSAALAVACPSADLLSKIGLPALEPVRIPLSAAEPAPLLQSPLKPMSSRMPRPSASLHLSILPVTPEMEPAPRPEAPDCAPLLALAPNPVRESLAQPVNEIEPLPSLAESIMHPDLLGAKTTSLAGLGSPMAMARFEAVAAGASAFNAAALNPISSPNPPRQVLLQPSVALRPRQLSPAMAGGSRYPMEYRRNSDDASVAGPLDFPLLAADVVLPKPPAVVGVAASARLDQIVPEVRGLERLTFRLGPPAQHKPKPVLSDIATIPQPLRTEHIFPHSGLQPLDAKPVADQFQPEAGEAPATAANPVSAKTQVWMRTAALWKLAPRDLKMLAFAIPALLALAFHRELPKVHISAPPTSTAQLRRSIQNVVNTKLTTVRQAVMERAAIALDEDFRSGLDDWGSRGDATAGWSFDATGFVRPGPPALYRPSMNLTDYEVQFLGMIDKKALSWVVRAADFDNYYVVKLEVLKPGPRTTVGLVRYAVIDGKAQDRVDTPVPLEAQPDTLYRVRLDAEGENFSLYIQGQMIDSWSEPRLMRGGIGFFTSKGEESRLRWVSVTHQYDMLGRLCAYLAPYEIPTTNGSW